MKSRVDKEVDIEVTENTCIENLLFEMPDLNTSSLEKTPKQIIWERTLPSIREITEKLPSLTQLVIEERENE